MGESADQVIRTPPERDDDALTAQEAEVQQTREEMSETLDAIQAKLAPERLTDDARDAAVETVDHVVDEVKTTAQELSELASVAAQEAIDHALEKVKEALPDLRQQAKMSAQEWSELASVAAMEAVDHTIDEAKGAVRDLSQEAKAAVRDATIGRVERMANTTGETTKYIGSTTLDTIRRNPGPAALTALGVGWLVMSGRRSGTSQTRTSGSAWSADRWAPGDLGGQAQSTAEQAQATAGNIAGQVQDSVGSAVDQVQGSATDLADQVQGTATQVAGQVQDTVSAAADQVQATAGDLASQAKQAPSRLRQMIEENPIPLGLVALALGGAAALAIPESRRENELLGEARDTVVDRAQAAAQTTIEKVQRVAEEAGETAAKEAKYEGLTPEQT